MRLVSMMITKWSFCWLLKPTWKGHGMSEGVVTERSPEEPRSSAEWSTWETALTARLPKRRPIAIILVGLFCLLTWFGWMLALERPIILWDGQRGFLAPGFWFAIIASFGVAYGLVSFFGRDFTSASQLELLPLATDMNAAGLETAWRDRLDRAVAPSRNFALLGVGIAFLSMVFLLGPPALRAQTPAQLMGLAGAIWYFVVWMVGFWFLFRGLWLTGAQQALYVQVMRDPRIDLLDLSPFDICGRRAVDGAVSSSVAATGVALVIVHPVVGLHPIALGGLLAALGMVAYFFVMALLPAHEAITRAKTAELKRVRALMRTHLDGSPAQGIPSFQDLLAWEARVKAVSEWPLNPAIAQRFGGLLASPLLGWAASAAVNAGLDGVLS